MTEYLRRLNGHCIIIVSYWAIGNNWWRTDRSSWGRYRRPHWNTRLLIYRHPYWHLWRFLRLRWIDGLPEYRSPDNTRITIDGVNPDGVTSGSNDTNWGSTRCRKLNAWNRVIYGTTLVDASEYRRLLVNVLRMLQLLLIYGVLRVHPGTLVRTVGEAVSVSMGVYH